MLCRDFHANPERFQLDVEAKLHERAFVREAGGTLEVGNFLLTLSPFNTSVSMYRKCMLLLCPVITTKFRR